MIDTAERYDFGALQVERRAVVLRWRRRAVVTRLGRVVSAIKPRHATGWFHRLSASWEFSAGCNAGQRFWAKVDERSHDPNYRAGWEGP